MSTSPAVKKTPAETATAAAPVPVKDTLKKIEAETRDEIDQILNEVEQLRKELGEDSGPNVSPHPSARRQTAGDATEPSLDATHTDTIDPDADLLKEFRAVTGVKDDEESGLTGLEDTLSELPETFAEDPSANVFDQLEETSEAAVTPANDNGVVTPDAETPAVLAEHPGAEVIRMSPSNAQQEKNTMPRAPKTTEEQPGTLSITLTGSMTLNLNYEFEGQTVTVGFSENFLKIALADGTEFKIPVGSRPTGTRRLAG